ncbi:D-dopachrome decarboxylase-A-like [Pristis pectinata]|uniref:D-dopachrome decarboxylase-A-like n=1 Tax=Pristis pectinata TaxID=685728 RepID=UPI00223DE643|nr:D-dopachrome decarboxylase-A-like [Pristis pectinata]
MPLLELESNLAASCFPEALMEQLSWAVATILDKPQERINVSVKPNILGSIGGSMSPCAQLIVSSIGVVGTAKQNKEHSNKFFEFLTRELGLSADRILIQFHPLEKWQIGEKGTIVTFL